MPASNNNLEKTIHNSIHERPGWLSTIKTYALAGLMAAGTIIGCDNPVEPDLPKPKPEYNEPTATITANPTTGKTGYTTTIEGICEDTDKDLTTMTIWDPNNNSFRHEINITGEKAERSFDYNVEETTQAKILCTDKQNLKDEATIELKVEEEPEQVIIIGPGQLQDNETDSGRQGIIGIFNPDSRNLLQRIETDMNGNYPEIELNAELNNILIGAYITDGTGQPTGFTRYQQIQVPSSNKIIELDIFKTVPYDGLTQIGINLEDFIKHANEVTDGIIQRWENVLIYIMETSFLSNNIPIGKFEEEQQQYIHDKLNSPEYALPFFGNKELNIVIGYDGDPNAPFTQNGPNLEDVQLDNNTLVVYMDTTDRAYGHGGANDVDGDGIFDIGGVRLNIPKAEADDVLDQAIVHEAGHAAGHLNHTETFTYRESIMAQTVYSFTLTSPSRIDKKVSLILYEENFEPGTNIDDYLNLEEF